MYQRQATQDIVLMLMLQYACLWTLGQLQQQPQLLSFSSIGFAASLSGWEHYSCRTCFSISALVIKIYQSQVVIASLEQAFIHIQCIRMHYIYIFVHVVTRLVNGHVCTILRHVGREGVTVSERGRVKSRWRHTFKSFIVHVKLKIESDT